MTDTLSFIADNFHLDVNQKPPIAIHNINRTIMAQTLGQLGFKEGAEVGVAEGFHAKVLCEHIPGLKLHCVDLYQKYPGYEEYADPQDCLRQAGERLRPYDTILYRKLSMDAVNNFPNGSLDFAYIDAAHDFRSVAEDVFEWSKRVRIGGIVFGHDYKYWMPWKSKYVKDVRPVVEAYCYAKNIHPWFILTNDIRDTTFGPDSPGWMFVRQKSDKI